MSAGVWLVALLAFVPARPQAVAADVDRILDDDRYLFCQAGNGYQPGFGDARWCELLGDETRRRCPGLLEVCARAGSGEEDSGEEADDPEGERAFNKRVRRQPEVQLRQMPSLAGFARIMMWLVLAGLLGWGVWALVRSAVKGERETEDDEPEPELGPDPGDSLLAAQLAAARVVETDVQRLLTRAEQAAGRGDHDAAIHDVHAALLRRLEGERLIQVDAWKTNGDFVRELRERPQLRDEVRAVVREVEQVQFGSAPAEASRYQSVRAKVLAILSRTTLALALALGLGSLTSCDGGCVPKAEADPAELAGLGTGPQGARAVAELLWANDIEARHRFRTLDQLAQSEGAIVLLAGVSLQSEEWTRLLEWVEDDGGMLIVATGAELSAELELDYRYTGEETGLAVHGMIGDLLPEPLELRAPPGRSLAREDLYGVATLLERFGPSDDSESWWYQDRVYAVVQDVGDEGGKIAVFAEPELFTNAALAVGDSGALLVNLLRWAEIDEVEFVDSFTGAGSQTPFESVRNGRLGPLFIQLLLFVALLYLAVGLPFARLRDRHSQRRRAFAEHVRTLGQRYAQARAARHVAAAYSGWALDRLRERLAPGAARGLLPLAQAIAARTGRDEGAVMQILVEAHGLREPGASRGGPAELALIRKLAHLLAETAGASSASRDPGRS